MWPLAAAVLGLPAAAAILGMAIKGYPVTKGVLIIGAAYLAMLIGTGGHPARIIQHFGSPPRKMSSKEQTGLVAAIVLAGLAAAILSIWIWPPS